MKQKNVKVCEQVWEEIKTVSKDDFWSKSPAKYGLDAEWEAIEVPQLRKVEEAEMSKFFGIKVKNDYSDWGSFEARWFFRQALKWKEIAIFSWVALLIGTLLVIAY